MSPAHHERPGGAGGRAFRWASIPGGVFGRHVVTLASGTAVGQVLLVLALPVLTRLYTPADYGALAVYSATLTVLLVLASLRFEQAIPLPEDDRVAGSLLALSLLSLTLVALLSGPGRAGRATRWSRAPRCRRCDRICGCCPSGWPVPARSKRSPTGRSGAGVRPDCPGEGEPGHRPGRHPDRTRAAQAGAPGLLIGDVIGRVAGGGGLALLASRDRPFAQVTRASLAAAAGRYRRFRS